MTKTSTTIPRELITNTLDAAGLDTYIWDDYWGRGMFGGTYPAVSFNDVSELALFVFYLALEAADWDEPVANAAEGMLSQTEVDSAGSGIVAYWPGYTFTKE
jgi:hypothetical protein